MYAIKFTKNICTLSFTMTEPFPCSGAKKDYIGKRIAKDTFESMWVFPTLKEAKKAYNFQVLVFDCIEEDNRVLIATVRKAIRIAQLKISTMADLIGISTTTLYQALRADAPINPHVAAAILHLCDRIIDMRADINQILGGTGPIGNIRMLKNNPDGKKDLYKFSPSWQAYASIGQDVRRRRRKHSAPEDNPTTESSPESTAEPSSESPCV